MKKFLITLVMAVLPLTANAAGGSGHLDHMDVDLHNQASLQRGMKTFVNYCMGCHSAEYQRYERAAIDLGMNPEVVAEHLIFGDLKVGEQMTISMSKEDAGKWFGNPPPDLTLEARLRGGDWLYTYLRSFYADDSRPWGVNNAVFKDVGMPNVLGSLQGVVKANCSWDEMNAHGLAGHGIDPLTNTPLNSCASVVDGTGELSPQEFDKVVYDLVNFMVYMGEPSKLDSHRIGTYVLIFLFLFFFLAYALKKEFWKDIH
ncbi:MULTISPECIES: cytochrome c1 [unclassified Neptuniibacter]|jgi:ubiquinol-cytochrome c reductase cytochrome c1 subunit|uniref:cytochrome c1 n=1 Tax=unclassified Neptuniibacter TaxID=2630693 RepID=UPI0026E2B3B4|nr:MULTISPECIES: cytochrome c1 [unclassified Neptuniibacter]MDO6512861.1 cytochrome c1 [Neptuniibacter sp. 2_MG-2023]MDO6592955.1 cytochrome c1 [Neptuniibacter sp. 1_MG-2023]